MSELTGSTRIRLSQIIDLHKVTADRAGDKVGVVRRWKDGKLHQKMEHGWRVLPEGSKYNPRVNKKDDEKTADYPRPRLFTDQDKFNGFIDRLYNYPHVRENEQITIKLPMFRRSLMKQIGFDENTNFIFGTRMHHLSPERKAKREQELREEEYRSIPRAIRKAKKAVLEKKSGNFKIYFPDRKNPQKVNKIVFGKVHDGNYIVTVGKVDKRNMIDQSKEKAVGAGVPPAI